MGGTNFNFLFNGIILLFLLPVSGFSFNCEFFEDEKKREYCENIDQSLIPNLILEDSIMANHTFITEFNNNQQIEIETIDKQYLKDMYLKISRVEPSIKYNNTIYVSEETTIYTDYNYNIKIPKDYENNNNKRRDKTCRITYSYILEKKEPIKEELTNQLYLERELNLNLEVTESTYTWQRNCRDCDLKCQFDEKEITTESIHLKDNITLKREIEPEVQFIITDEYHDTIKGNLETNYNTEILFDNSQYTKTNYIFTPELEHNYLQLKAVKVNQTKHNNLIKSNNNLYIQSKECETKKNTFFEEIEKPCTKELTKENNEIQKQEIKTSLNILYILSIFTGINYIIYKFLRNMKLKFFTLPLILLFLINPVQAVEEECGILDLSCLPEKFTEYTVDLLNQPIEPLLTLIKNFLEQSVDI